MQKISSIHVHFISARGPSVTVCRGRAMKVHLGVTYATLSRLSDYVREAERRPGILASPYGWAYFRYG